ncbi:S8 family peptidase [Anaerocolumna sp. MB42-C2]|uniref:S8 family peptidase n=1 Tax=Anaerocolumna sp. MB42-C2 TaxID=3070997 RepID=UPI0027DF0972|nr:S8 family peptidase [Anaerocolumna sp. MB42-C2]WMJ86007.1 S8 family peptidase [Anaerocolumna sp. MB42-C2]
MDQNCGDRIISEDYADLLIEYRRFPQELSNIPDSCSNVINENHAVVYAPINLLPGNIVQSIGYFVFPTLFGLADTGSLEASGITRLLNIPSFDLSGQGVLVGFIDTGIDYTHPAFINADGTTKILSIWDQTIQTGPSPNTYYYGTEYTREQINLALVNEDPISIVPSIDEIGHGTSLAGLTAGNPSLQNNFSGVVPSSDIVVVKLKQAKKFIRNYFLVKEDAICFQENDIMFGIRYLTDAARELNRPIAICIGLETNQGSHDGRGALSSYLSLLGDQAGIAITIAAGNEGNAGHHFRGVIESGGQQSEILELRVGANNSGFSMELWGDSPGTFSVDILSPTGEYIPRIPARIGETRVIRFIFEETVVNIDYILLEQQTGDQLILLRFVSPTEGIWRFRVYSTGDLTSTFNVWLPIQSFMTSEAVFVQPDPDYTVTSPGNAVIPIIVTAYDYTNNSLYLNASRGYTRIDTINPNLAAPGVNLVVPAPGGTYTTASGTSLAAAHTTGVAAMLLEWGITTGYYSMLDSVEIKNLLIRGARRDPNNVYPNKEWGYGILDVYNTFNSLRGD